MKLFCSVFAAIFTITYSCLLENGKSSIYLSMFEDLKPGQSVGHLPIKGSISGEAPEISLNVVKGNDLVSVDPGSKELKLLKEVDRDEGFSKFEAVIECKSKDLESDFSQLNISVFVTVKDVNDNAPEFDAEEYNITIKEELPIGTIVFTDFEAVDRDQPGPNSFLQYSIVKGANSELLDIPDPFKPVVVVKNRIDYEKLKSFDVELQARDQGEPSRSSTVPLHVTVENINDLNPYFSRRHYIARKIKNSMLILEPEPVKVVDADNADAEILFELEGAQSSDFTVDKRGIIRTKSQSPPRSAVLFLNAYEKENRDRNATAVVQLIIGSSIHFQHSTYSARIPKSSTSGSPILTVKAYSENNTIPSITYRVSGPAGVSIDAMTGALSVSDELKEGTFAYNITASAGEEEVNVPFTLMVDSREVCKDKLEFEKSEYKLQMNSLPILGTIRVKGENAATYTLMNMNKDFIVDDSGVVRIHPGARPTCSKCELIVVATNENGALSVTKIIIENSLYPASTATTITIFVLIILAIFFIVVLLIVFWRMYSACKDRKRSNICWLNSTDTGITIASTIPTSHNSRYTVTSTTDKERSFEKSKSPAPKRAQGAHLVPVTVSNQAGAPTVYF